ncbi:hypothetical protein M378DRAFT_165274 [Amanita muscaria Koide BX008]|uniref:Uncharacterized protein n=1 Tax=Amanita muscaria (strain Koide BX008) TaxID=946122 RepID=A0A0C2WMJ6_AMAMK|nr:hypothetical protein M378DRAFT_165274 [Amanita muscaria Koide BX008]
MASVLALKIALTQPASFPSFAISFYGLCVGTQNRLDTTSFFPKLRHLFLVLAHIPSMIRNEKSHSATPFRQSFCQTDTSLISIEKCCFASGFTAENCTTVTFGN